MKGKDGKEWDRARFINWAVSKAPSKIHFQPFKRNPQAFRKEYPCPFCFKFFNARRIGSHKLTCTERKR